MRKIKWPVGTFVEDMQRMCIVHTPETGDGRVYIVRDIHGEYYAGSLGTSTMWVTAKKKAKKFYDGQEAWGAARRSIYPAEVLIVGRVSRTK